jgi:hypothetical protein
MPLHEAVASREMIRPVRERVGFGEILGIHPRRWVWIGRGDVEGQSRTAQCQGEHEVVLAHSRIE